MKPLPRACRGVRRGEHLTNRLNGAFTLIELIVVVGVILILTGLVLSTAGYARKKGARARAETEIAAMAAAIESYKADNGVYPRGPTTAIPIGTVTIPANVTDSLNARQKGDPTNTADPTYGETSLYLYTLLSGDSTGTRSPTGKSYMVFKPNMLYPPDQSQSVQYIRDPFGYSYGYSTSQAANPGDMTKGYNATFDLWSTAGLTAAPGGVSDTITPQWIKNW